MAWILRTECGACGYRSAERSDAFLVVLMDESSESMFADPEDRRMVALPHPGEDHTLKELGFALEQAVAEGRLGQARLFLCGSCGEGTYIRRLCVPESLPGCGTAVAAGVVYGLLAWLVTRIWWAGVVVGLAGFAVHQWQFEQRRESRVRRRFPDRVRLIETPHRCGACRSRDLVKPGMLTRGLPCPKCAARRLRVVSVGIS